MAIRIIADATLKTGKNHVGSTTEYSTQKLVLLLPSLSEEAITYTWISPTNTRFIERLMFRDEDEDEEDYVAYSATIFPVMTAGVSATQNSGISFLSFRKGNVFSSMIKIAVEKSVLPEQSILLPTVAETLEIEINNLKARVLALENK